MTLEQYIDKFNKTHNFKYDYSLFTDFKNNRDHIKIICPIHGVYEQSIANHSRGNGCRECSKLKSIQNLKIKKVAENEDDFINKANIKYNNYYDYSKSNYKNNQTKTIIICPIHGEFIQTPINHLSGVGCKKCYIDKIKTNQKDFINSAKEIHIDKNFDYSLVEYKNSKTKVKMICPIHGIFEQTPANHIHKKQGCPECAKESKRLSNEEYIIKSNLIHNNFYNYSKTNLIKSVNDKVTIICPIHGEFIQRASTHLVGHGCPKCSNKNRRLSTIKRIEDNKLNGYQLYPNYNKNACEIFDKIMIKENIFIQHAMNLGEYYIKELGYWIDGYDKQNNVVYEFDEKHHFNKHGELKEKDKIRQQEIENILKCKFIRIK